MSPLEPHGPPAHEGAQAGRDERGPDPSTAASISRRLVQLMSRYTGRGPTQARTVLNPGFALVILEDTLTKGEHSLVDAGEHASVLAQRRTFQSLMRDESIAAVEEITGRRVRTYLSDFSPIDGIAADLFLFEPLAEPEAVETRE